MTYSQVGYLIAIIYCLVVTIELLILPRLLMDRDRQWIFWVIMGLTTAALIWAIEYVGKMYENKPNSKR